MNDLNVYCYHTQWKDNAHTTFIAVLDGVPVGTIMVEYGGWNNSEVMLWNLNVAPDHRKKGFGKQLLNLAIGDAVERINAKAVHLQWFAEDTPGWVLDWYKRRGFYTDAKYNGVKEKQHVVLMTLDIKKKKGEKK